MFKIRYTVNGNRDEMIMQANSKEKAKAQMRKFFKEMKYDNAAIVSVKEIE